MQRLQKKFLSQRNGCSVRHSNEFLVHCIEDCVKYKKLKLIRKCDFCPCKFINKNALSIHRGFAHKKDINPMRRPWMTKVQISHSGIKNFNSSIECTGCKK